MNLLRIWLLPSVLVGVQVVLWPGLPVLRAATPEPVALAAGLVAALGTLLGLAWRQRRPVPALVAVLAAQTLARLATPGDAMLVLGLAELVAVWAVAVREPGRVLRLALAGGALWAVLVNLPRYGLGATYVGEVVLAVLGYLLAAGLGRSRRHWLAGRVAAADRLAAAQDQLRRAARTERHRLARELHDVSAHHLTSIVVTVGAAERLAERRPELAAEAVRFAGRTGRETRAALHRLVAVMGQDEVGDRPLRLRVTELVDGFRQLGLSVRLDWSAAEPPPRVAEAAYAVVREALTNTVRHAAGAGVLVRVATVDGALAVTVTDGGGPAPVTTSALGAGRGIDGLRERVAALGGSLWAGPVERGWRVRAVLPPTPVTDGTRESAASGDPRSLVTVAVVGNVLVFPVAAMLVSLETDPSVTGVREPVVFGTLLLLCAARAVPLVWRRRHPWAVLAAVNATTVLWPVVALLAGLPPDAVLVLFSAFVADLAAVWAVAAHARRAGTTWLAVPLTAGIVAAGLVGTAAADGSLAEGPVHVPATIAVTVVTTALLLLPALSAWAGGMLVRRRRRRVLGREDDALAAAASRAVAVARAERERVGAGLRSAVLERAGRLVRAADRSELAEILAEARATLAAMRDLLDGLRADDDRTPGHPQPTLAAAGTLCASWRARGREVDLDAPPAVPPLPTDVDVSAYRLVEVALDAGAAPARVTLRVTDRQVRLHVTGMDADPDPVAVAGLRARVDVLGGWLAVRRGVLSARLPLPGPAFAVDGGPAAATGREAR